MRRNWVDTVYARLQELGPGEWRQIGPLFDEVRLQIPLHTAVRRMRTKYNHDGEAIIPPAEQAQWLSFSSFFSRLDNVECKGTRRERTYADVARLKEERVRCPSCNGPVTKLRGRRSLGLCMMCRNTVGLEPPASERTGQEERQPPARLDDPRPQPVITREPARAAEPPDWPEFKMPVPQKMVFHVTHRRRCAQAIRNLLPMRRIISINMIERQLQQEHDDVWKVLQKHGINSHQTLITLINNRHLRETLLTGKE